VSPGKDGPAVMDLLGHHTEVELLTEGPTGSSHVVHLQEHVVTGVQVGADGTWTLTLQGHGPTVIITGRPVR